MGGRSIGRDAKRDFRSTKAALAASDHLKGTFFFNRAVKGKVRSAKGLHGYDMGEGLLLDRTVISVGCSKLAAQVADRMFHLIHNLEQNCTQTSLGSIYRYRKRQIIIGWSQYWTGRQT